MPDATTPEVPHADLIARLRKLIYSRGLGGQDTTVIREAADALAALGDTVPREQYNEAIGDAQLGADMYRVALRRYMKAERERDEARAERDALALLCNTVEGMLPKLGEIGHFVCSEPLKLLALPPAVSLALHDAEVWDEGVRAKSASSSIFDADALAQNPYRAAAVREAAKK